jgi:hypothetical protein
VATPGFPPGWKGKRELQPKPMKEKGWNSRGGDVDGDRPRNAAALSLRVLQRERERFRRGQPE